MFTGHTSFVRARLGDTRTQSTSMPPSYSSFEPRKRTHEHLGPNATLLSPSTRVSDVSTWPHSQEATGGLRPTDHGCRRRGLSLFHRQVAEQCTFRAYH